MTSDLSAFKFDIRKDALIASHFLTTGGPNVLEHLFRCTVTWLAPMLPFSAEEAWLARYAPAMQKRQGKGAHEHAPQESVHWNCFRPCLVMARLGWLKNGAR
jgi:isoleucyl-tRNA synthetase